MADERPVHLHLGAGRLGLGLVVPTTRRCGLNVTVVARPNANAFSTTRNHSLAAQSTYHLLVRETGERSPVEIDEFLVLDEATRELVDRILKDPRTALITTAVGKANLELLVPRLRELLDVRFAAGVTAPLLVIPCENDVGAEYHRLTTSGPPRVFFLDAVVDRICYRVTCSAPGDLA